MKVMTTTRRFADRLPRLARNAALAGPACRAGHHHDDGGCGRTRPVAGCCPISQSWVAQPVGVAIARMVLTRDGSVPTRTDQTGPTDLQLAGYVDIELLRPMPLPGSVDDRG